MYVVTAGYLASWTTMCASQEFHGIQLAFLNEYDYSHRLSIVIFEDIIPYELTRQWEQNYCFPLRMDQTLIFLVLW